MTAPSQKVREATYRRDGYRCVSCGAQWPLSWQHRSASGHGGRGRKAPALTPADGLTACIPCNGRFESDLQELALHNGWKLRRHILMTADQVPFYDRNLGGYFLPDTEGRAHPVKAAEAIELITAAGGYTTKGGRA